ncbi:MAG TPA: FAD binding domain-containing protein [Bacillota bacterium]|nr:FAD binding domain-containing protein [Bacillota bacterium]
MIPYTFDYYRPGTIEEAVHIYQELDAAGKSPLYYSGGSEIISMARVNNILTKAVIDLKAIPECIVLEKHGGLLYIGASETLSAISESNLYPLLTKACGRIADHTMQCRITIGGNVCGTIIYKEAILPLFLSDCSAVVAGKDGIRKIPVHKLFDETLRIKKGEFIVQFMIEEKYLTLPYYHIKKTKNEKIDYPLLSVAAVCEEGNIRIAFSGLCEFPFRSAKIESEMNNSEVTLEERVRKVMNQIPAPVLNDISGSDRYRLFMLKNILINIEREMEGQRCLS